MSYSQLAVLHHKFCWLPILVGLGEERGPKKVLDLVYFSLSTILFLLPDQIFPCSYYLPRSLRKVAYWTTFLLHLPSKMNFSWGSKRKYILYYAKYLPASISSLTQPRRPFAAAWCKAVCLVSGWRRSGEIFLSNRAHRRSSSRPSRAVKNSVYLWPMTYDEASLHLLQCMHSIYRKINLLDSRWSLLSITGVIKPREEGAPLHKSYFYVPPQSLWLLGRFGPKTGRDFAHFDQESNNMVFTGTTKVYECICYFNPIINKKERVIIYVNTKYIFRNFFVGVIILREARSENGYGFHRPGLKIGVENDIFGPEIGSEVGEPDGTSLPIWQAFDFGWVGGWGRYFWKFTHPPKVKSLPYCFIFIVYWNSKVFSFLKRGLACTENSPKKPENNVSNQDFLYRFKKAKWWKKLMRLYYIYFELSSILI